jgi:hypothetical protein
MSPKGRFDRSMDATIELDSPKAEVLPPDAAHVPFELIVIPPGAEEPPVESSERQFRLRLPEAQTSTPLNEVAYIELIDVNKIATITEAPRHKVPESLIRVHKELEANLRAH